MRHHLATLTLALYACRSTTPPAPPPPTHAEAAAPTRDVPTVAPTPAPPALSMHIEPVTFAAEGVLPAVRVEFPGDATQALGVRMGEDTPDAGAGRVSVENWPSAVRVRMSARAHNGSVYVLVETATAHDRPAGLRSLLELRRGSNTAGTWTTEVVPLGMQRAARAIEDAAALSRLINAPDTQGSTDTCDAALAAARTPAGLGRVVDAAGLDVFVKWSDGLVTFRESLSAQDVRSPARATPLARAVARVMAPCVYNAGEVVGEGRAARLRSVRVDAEAPAPTAPVTPPTAPTAVPANGDRLAVERFLRARFPGEPRVIAAAPLTAQGGLVAAAIVDAFEWNVLVTHEGEVWRVLPFGRGANTNADRVREARFVEANGDGRTDVVIETEARDLGPDMAPRASTRPFGHRGLYLVPPATMAAGLVEDSGAIVALNAAPSFDAAVTALASVPWRGVTSREVCAAVQAGRTRAGLRGVATEDFRFLLYEEPGSFAWRPEFVPLTDADASASLIGGALPCGMLECSSTRPVCTWSQDDGPGGGGYWFRWENGRLRLTAIAIYNGS